MNLDRLIAVRNNKTVYRDGDKCVKVFCAQHAKSDVLNEALKQARMEEIGLNVPKIIEVIPIDGKWAIVSEFIKGRTLAQMISENPEKKMSYMELMAQIHRTLQAAACPELDMHENKIRRSIERSGLDGALCRELCSRLETMPVDNKICHGDFNPSNIIITEHSRPYILDWPHATCGNASADAAMSYLLLRLSGENEGAERYIDAFCNGCVTAKENVKKWIPIIAAAQFGKSNEKTREFLSSWLVL